MLKAELFKVWNPHKRHGVADVAHGDIKSAGDLDPEILTYWE
jgi:hypothetical protein